MVVMPDMLRVGRLLAIGALGIAGLGADVSSRQLVSTSQLTGTARITGRVIAADDGKPVRRAAVVLSGHADSDADHLRVIRRYETDFDGRFEFVDLPAGAYAIYFDRLTGFVAPKSNYQQTKLTERQAVELNVRVQRTGAIEGRILDQYGDPLLRAEVLAVERVDVAGYVAWGTRRASASTNDRGEFRIFNLPAGDYFLVASNAPSQHPHDLPPPALGDVTTYYPGSPQRREARAVTVQAGRDTKVESFSVSRRTLAKISIAAVDSRGNTLGTEGSVSLRRLDAPDGAWSTRAGQRNNSEFVLRGVEPGDYSLVVWTKYGTGESAYLKISIDQKDVSLKVQTTTGARVSGRVIVDGQPANGGTGQPKAWVSAHKPARSFGVSYAEDPYVQLRATDRFELTGLRGPMVLSGRVTFGSLVSIRRGADELAWKVLDFAGTENLDDVVVEFTTKVTRLELTVPTPAATSSEEPVVFIFPEDRQRWRPGLAFQVSVPTRTLAGTGAMAEGSTRVNVLPGRYYIVALNTAAVVDPSDPELLEKLARLAAPTELAAGDLKLTIPLANAPR